MTALLIGTALLLAFSNGANDNLKGVATLYGSGALSYRASLALATVSTALGSLASVPLAAGLVTAFSAKGLLPDALLDTSYLAAVGAGASLTVLVATRAGLPVSTTHALVGGLAGAGLVAAGPALDLRVLGRLFLLPLVASPLMAVLLAAAAYRGSQAAGRRLGVESSSCVCVGETWVPLSPSEAAVRRGLSLGLGSEEECRQRYSGRIAGVSAQSAITAAHLASASLVGFARGLNDTPKILGLLVAASVLSPLKGALAVTLAMAAGGLLAARPVAETLARKITPMTPGQGLAGNVATSFLVVVASRLGLPVSTTHVSTGGIFGVGSAGGGLRRGTTAAILMAWLITLPMAALAAAAAMKLLG